MRRRFFAAVGAGVLAVGAAVADPPTPTAALVERLGSESFAEREAAGRELEARGPAAIPALEAATRSPNPEVSFRAGRLLARARRVADSSAHTTARPVRLAYRNVPVAAAVSDLARTTGVNLKLDPDGVADPLRRVTCETGDLPPWEAVAAFCEAAGLTEVFAAELDAPGPDRTFAERTYYTPPPPIPGADAVPVVLADGRPTRLPGTRATNLRVLALPAGFPLNRAALGTGEFALNLDITPIPGMNWKEVVGVRVTRVVDSAGRFGGGRTPAGGGRFPGDPLSSPPFGNPGVAVRWGFDGNPMTPTAVPNPRVVPVHLRVETPTARSLAEFEGVVIGEVTVPEQQLVTVEHPAKAVGQVFPGPGGVRFTILDVTDAAGQFVVRVRLGVPSPVAAARRRAVNPWGPMWPEPPRPGAGHQVIGLDAAGRPVPPGGTQTDVTDDGETMTTTLRLTYRPGVELPTKLAVVGPKAVTVEVPFRMANVPLP